MSNNLINILPEELRTIAAELVQLSSNTDTTQQSLSRSWARLDAGWDTYAEESVLHHYNQMMEEQSRMGTMLLQMGQALASTADVIEAADQASQALFDAITESSGSKLGSWGEGELPPRQGGDMPFPSLPPEVQRLLAELFALLAALPPGTSLDDLLELLDGQPIAVGFQLYVGASGSFSPGAVAVNGNVFVIYNFNSHELSIVVGDEAALGVAGGAEVDAGGGCGFSVFYGVDSNDVFNGGVTNLTVGADGALGLGAETSFSVTVMYDPHTGAPVVGVGVTNGMVGGAGADVSATISVPGMNDALVIYTTEVDLESFGDIPAVLADSFINDAVNGTINAAQQAAMIQIISGALAANQAADFVNDAMDTAQQAAMIPVVLGALAAAQGQQVLSGVINGVDSAIDAGGDFIDFWFSGSPNTSPFPPEPVPTPSQNSGDQAQQTPVSTPLPSGTESPDTTITPVPGPTPEATQTPTP